MEGKERDQRAYEKVKPHLSGLLLNIVLQMVEELRDHYLVRPKQTSLVAVVNSRVRGQAAPMQSPPSGRPSVWPSGPIICRAFRLDYEPA